MSKSVNQSIAWVSAVFLSLVVFGAGYGLFNMVAHADSSGEGEKTSSHDEHGKAEGHGEHGKAEESHDAHGEKADEHGEKAAAHDAHGEAPEKTASHGEHEEKAADHGDKKGGDHEEEISADQFKAKPSEHH